MGNFMGFADDDRRYRLPPGSANGEPQLIPGRRPPKPGDLPPGTGHGEPYIIPPAQRPAAREIMNDREAVDALNEWLGGKPDPPADGVLPEKPVVAERQPVPAKDSPTDITNMSPQDWKDLVHVQDVMRQMPGDVARHFQFRAPGELMANQDFQKWEGMSDEERFLRGAMREQILGQTHAMRQARMHGLMPHQFSGFGGANDGTSAEFYRAVPRTKADPQVIKAALEGAGDSPARFQESNARADQMRFARSPQGMAMNMINNGVPPEVAMDTAARMIQMFGGGGGGYGMMPQSQMQMPAAQPSMAEQRAVYSDMQRQIATHPTMAELLGKRPSEEFDVNDLYDAYQKWIDGKLNDADLNLLSQFIRARGAAGLPVEVPRSMIWDTEARSGLRSWLESLKAGQIDRPTLEQSYQSGAQGAYRQNADRWLDIFSRGTGIPVDGE